MASGDRWAPEGPPEEAYSRVSDETRYLGLHAVANELVTALRRRFAVTAEEVVDPGPWRAIARATRLTPDGPGTAITLVDRDRGGRSGRPRLEPRLPDLRLRCLRRARRRAGRRPAPGRRRDRRRRAHRGAAPADRRRRPLVGRGAPPRRGDLVVGHRRTRRRRDGIRHTGRHLGLVGRAGR